MDSPGMELELMTIRLEGKDVYPARILGGNTDAFSSPKFVLVKTRWMSDNEAQNCYNCVVKFTQIRRRHHCRQCGKILCGKCCKDKIPLPQLGIDVSERVCSSCFSIVDLISKSRSPQMHFRIEAAKVLAEYSEDPQMVSKVVELGGVQALIALSNMEDNKIQNEVFKGLHTLSLHQPLHSYLTVSGAAKAISHVLDNKQNKEQELLMNGISTLYLLCKSPNLRTKVIYDGALTPILNLCTMDDTIALVAMKTLSLIVEDDQTHSIIVDNQRTRALSHILTLCRRTEPQIQLISLKILAHISTSSDWNRHRIIQENSIADYDLKEVFNNPFTNEEILSTATCLMANLAACSKDQNGLLTFQNCLCSLISEDHNNTILCNIMRGIANFAKFKLNAPILMQVFPKIIAKGLMSKHDDIRIQAARVTAFLLAHMPEQTIEHLMSNGVAEFLTSLSSLPLLTGCLVNLFHTSCPQLAAPS